MSILSLLQHANREKATTNWTRSLCGIPERPVNQPPSKPNSRAEAKINPESIILIPNMMIKHYLFAYSCLQPESRKTQNVHLVLESLRAIAKSPLRRLESTRQPRHRPHTGSVVRSKLIRATDSRGGKHITGTAHRARSPTPSSHRRRSQDTPFKPSRTRLSALTVIAIQRQLRTHFQTYGSI